jgi:hypothetical protein
MSLATYLLLTTSSDVFTAHSLATTDLTASSNSIGRFIYRTIFFRVRLTNAQHSRKYRGSAATISISAFKYRPALAASNRAVRLQPPIQDRYCCIHVQCTNHEVEFVVVQWMITLPAYDAASQQVFGRTRAKHHLLGYYKLSRAPSSIGPSSRNPGNLNVGPALPVLAG